MSIESERAVIGHAILQPGAAPLVCAWLREDELGDPLARAGRQALEECLLADEPIEVATLEPRLARWLPGHDALEVVGILSDAGMVGRDELQLHVAAIQAAAWERRARHNRLAAERELARWTA